MTAILKSVSSGMLGAIEAFSAERCFRILTGYVVALSAIQVTTLGLSIARVQISQVTAIGIVVVSVLAGWSTRFLSTSVSTKGQPDRKPVGWMQHVILLLVVYAALAYLVMWVIAYLQPDWSWDGNTYHIPTIHMWALKGYVYWIDQPFDHVRAMNGFPKGVEVLGFVIVKAFGNDALVNTTNLVYLPMGVLGIAYISSVLGASRSISLFSGATFVLVPVNIGQSVTTYIDTGLAASIVAFVAAFAHIWLKVGRDEAAPLSALPALGGSLGLAVGSKAPGLALALFGMPLLALIVLSETRRLPSANRSTFLRQAALFLAAVLAICLLVGGYWYVRNYLEAGSPLYPIEVNLAGNVILPGIDTADSMEQDETPGFMQPWPDALRVLFTWAQGIRNWPGSITGEQSRLGGLGYFWLIACIPATLAILYDSGRRPGLFYTPFFAVFALTTLTFLAFPMNWWARYTVWVYALGLPCFALVLSRILNCPRRGWLLQGWFVISVMMLVVESFVAIRAIRQTDLSVRTNPTAILDLRYWFGQGDRCCLFSEMKGTSFESLISAGSSVAVSPLSPYTGQRRLIGVLSFPLGHREVLSLPAVVDSATLDRVASQGIRYVIWDDNLSIPGILLSSSVIVEHIPGFWLLEMGK